MINRREGRWCVSFLPLTQKQYFLFFGSTYSICSCSQFQNQSVKLAVLLGVSDLPKTEPFPELFQELNPVLKAASTERGSNPFIFNKKW